MRKREREKERERKEREEREKKRERKKERKREREREIARKRERESNLASERAGQAGLARHLDPGKACAAQGEVDGSCQLCNDGPGTTFHRCYECPALQAERDMYVSQEVLVTARSVGSQ